MRNSRKKVRMSITKKETIKNYFIIKSEDETLKYFKVRSRVYKDKSCNVRYFQRLVLANSVITKRE
jgi:hypothetical protein